MDTTITPKHEEVSTYIFIDFETTGLLDQRQNCRITELSLIAVDRRDMLCTGVLPRVTNKVTLCINPIKPISPTSSNITGLFNDSLENKQPFSAETVQFINSFLKMHSKPICLLAHNGNRFDFPLLVAELKRIKQSLDEDILCADTLEMFRMLDGLSPRFEPNTTRKAGISTASPMILRTANESTPTKSTKSLPQSPQKRKLTPNHLSVVNVSPKIGRQSDNVNAVSDCNVDHNRLSKERVKVSLQFDDKNDKSKDKEFEKNTSKVSPGCASVKTEADNVDNSHDKTEDRNEILDNVNTNAADKEDSIPEFSNSLEDSDYLMALDKVENEFFGKEDLKKSKISNNVNKSMQAAESRPSCSRTPVSYVEMSSGYHVKHSTGPSDSVQVSDTTDTVTEVDVIDKNSEIVTDIKPAVTMNKEQTNKIYDSVSKPDECATSGDSSITKLTLIDSAIAKPTGNDCADFVASSCSITKSNQSSSLSSVIKPNQCASPYSITKSNIKASVSVSPSSVIKFSIRAESSDKPDLFTCGVISKESLTALATARRSSPIPSTSATTTVLSATTPVSSTSAIVSASPVNTTADSPSVKNTPTTNSTFSSPTGKIPSYKLEEIYLRKFGTRPPVSHCAEDDCITLLKVVKITPGCMEWIDQHAVLLSTIPMPF